METTSNTKNNNQNPIIQKRIKTSSRSSNHEGIYVCIPHTSSSIQALDLNYCLKSKENLHPNTITIKQEEINSSSSSEEPIDLTCSVKRPNSTFNIVQEQSQSQSQINELERSFPTNSSEYQSSIHSEDIPNENVIKGKIRKRRYETNTEGIVEDLQVPTLEPNLLRHLENPDYFQISGNKQAEVLRAAKSLFSKRTRTLYHWMYPNAPKTQLKTAISSSWETLGVQEKEFYISQVLGRFGFPQSNLMVNPQLGGLSSCSISSLPLLDLTTVNSETSKAVSSLLLSENDGRNNGGWYSNPGSSGMSSNRPVYTQRMSRKRRLGRPPGSKNKKHVKEEFAILKQIGEESVSEEFRDDPELSQEFERFKWTLHLNDNSK